MKGGGGGWVVVGGGGGGRRGRVWVEGGGKGWVWRCGHPPLHNQHPHPAYLQRTASLFVVLLLQAYAPALGAILKLLCYNLMEATALQALAIPTGPASQPQHAYCVRKPATNVRVFHTTLCIAVQIEAGPSAPIETKDDDDSNATGGPVCMAPWSCLCPLASPPRSSSLLNTQATCSSAASVAHPWRVIAQALAQAQRPVHTIRTCFLWIARCSPPPSSGRAAAPSSCSALPPVRARPRTSG